MENARIISSELSPTDTVSQSGRGATRFLLFAGGILGLAGASHLLAAFGRVQASNLPDPLFGLSLCSLNLLIGSAELLGAGVCLFSEKKILSLGLIAWMAMVILMYRVGASRTGWPHPWIFVGALASLLKISPLLADTILFSITIGFLFVSGVFVWTESKAPQTTAFIKMICPSCGGHINFPPENLGRLTACPFCETTLMLRKPRDLLKISCYFCQEHVEFPAHAIGQQIECPHCNHKLLLREP